MSDVAVASGYARRLVEGEAKTHDVPMRQAANTVARRLRVSVGSVWGLLYDPPKKVGSELLKGLKQGVERLLEQEMRRLQHELHVLKQSGEDPRSASFAEVEHHLAEARRALGISSASDLGGDRC